MIKYNTLDNLPDISAKERAAAGNLTYSSNDVNEAPWDNSYGTIWAPSLNQGYEIYKFNARAGATYAIASLSLNEPNNLRIYDSSGNAIVDNLEGDDFPGKYIGKDKYSYDNINNWVAPYSGDYYIDPGWGYTYKTSVYSLIILEDIDTANKVPTARNAILKGNEDQSIKIRVQDFGFSDRNPDDKIDAVIIDSIPEKGAMKINGNEISVGSIIDAKEIDAGNLTWTPSANSYGQAYAKFAFRVSDGKDFSTNGTTITFDVAPVNDGPNVANKIENKTATENQLFILTLPSDTFADVDGDTLTLKASLANGKSLPKWLTYNSKTGQFLGTPTDADSNTTLSIKITATDKGKISTSDTFNIEVLGVNVAPVAKAIAKPATATEGKAFTYDLPKGTFTDGDKGDVLTYKSDNQPEWLKIDSTTGKLSGTPGYAAADTGALTVKLTATDKSGLSSSTNLTIDLKETATIAGTASADVIVAGTGSDKITGGKGADVLKGGAGKDTFVFAKGDSGQATGFDQIKDFTKGAAGTGDLIDYSAALSLGGVTPAAATADRALINAKTGVATFAAGSGLTMGDALADVAMSLSLDGVGGKAKDVAGEFAFFQVNGSGDYYLFISDGKAGVTVEDVVVQLMGVSSIGGIDLTGGNLTITP